MKIPEIFPKRNANLLTEILAQTRSTLPMAAADRQRVREAAEQAPRPLDFMAALIRDRVALIAEVKRRSPSAGRINDALDPAVLARDYRDGGAAAISVLTEAAHFGGSLADLSLVGRSVQLPLLRKDFIVDPIQLHQARAAGASAVLLIARALPDRELAELRQLAERLDLVALVEVHDRDELTRAIESGARVIGVNARNLDDFSIDVEMALSLIARVPSQAIAVAESAMATASDVERAAIAGADAVLIGGALARSDDPRTLASELSGVARRGR